MSSWLIRSAVVVAMLSVASSAALADRATARRHKAAGDSAIASGAHKRGVKSYLAAIAADSSFMPAYGALSTHYLRWRQYKDAATLLTRAVRRAPRYANGWYNLAYALRKQNKLRLAVQAYRRYAGLRPASADPYYGIGLALRTLGDHAGAAKSFARYAQLEKRGERQAWVRKARALAKSEGAKAARSPAAKKRATNTRAAKRSPAKKSAAKDVAAKRPAAKTPLAKKPAAKKPAAKQPLAGGAAAATGKGGAGDSDATLKPRAVEGKSSAPLSAERKKAMAAARAGDRAYAGGQVAASVRYYRASIAADFSYTGAYDRLARALFRLGRFAQAVRMFRIAIRDIPEYHLGWYNLAYALRKAKRPREAVAAYRKFAALRPQDPDPYFGLGLAYRSMGDKPAAVRAFNRYIGLEKRAKQRQWVVRAQKIVSALGGTPATPGAAAAIAARAALPTQKKLPPKKKLTAAERRKLAAAERRRKRAEARRKRREAIAERRRLASMKRSERLAALKKKRAERRRKRAEARRRRVEARKAKIAELRRRREARRKGRSALVALPAGKPMAPPKGVEPAPDKPQPPSMPPAPEASPNGVAAGLRAQGDTLARNGRCVQAIKMYRGALRKDPFHTRAYLGIAYCGHKLKKHAVAARWLGVGLRDNPDWVDGWLLVARLWRSAGNDRRAVGALHKYLSKKPGDLEARFELARAQRKAGLSTQAIRSYRDYLKREKRAKSPQRMAAFVELASIGGKPPVVGGGSAAAAVAGPPRKLTRAERRKLARLARLEARRKRREALLKKRAAQREQRRIEREERKRKRAERLAKRREALKKRREAAKARREARRQKRLAQRSKLSARQQRLAELREQRRIEREERRRRRRGIKGSRRSRPARAGRGGRGRRARLDPSARAAARAAADMPPVPPRSRQRDVLKPAPAAARGLVEVADAQFAKSRYVVALGIYLQAAKLDPSATEPAYKAGVCAVALGRMHLAADMFERVLQQDPSNATAKVNLQMARAAAAKRRPDAGYIGKTISSARADLAAGRYALVERNLARVVRVAKPSPRLYVLRAEARLGLRKPRAALSDAGRALALDPSSAAALRALGDAQRQLGKRSKAIYYYRLYLARATKANDRAAIERVIRELEMPGGG